MNSSSSQPVGGGAEHEGFPQVLGKYVLVRPMARGGMGELFLAAAGETGGFEKLCVVKKVLANLDDIGVHRRFLDEAKVVVRLNHSNLVQVFDAGRVDNEYYLAMELVEGKDLRAVWNRCAQLHRRIPVDIAIFVTREIARGLAYVHDAMGLDLVHRDISPPNILIGYHGEVKLTDFGLAKSAIKREMTNPGVVFGRYSYLSPEQARGLPADRRTDIYASAIVLWELLTGRQLFPSSNRSHQEALAAVREPVVRAPSEVVPGIPAGLDEVVLTGLAREREDRYNTAGEFRAALSDVLVRHFPSCDADRVSDFMRDIFARERKEETQEYGDFTRRDFSGIRAAAQHTETISISDVILIEREVSGPMESTAIPLDDADIVEMEDEAPRRRTGAGELRESAKEWIGRTIARRYRVERLIGIGGMGAVFKVVHVSLGKPFALKVLHGIYTRDRDIVQRFMREARAATQTRHPNIIDVVDIGTTDRGEVYFVMELLEGGDLAEAVGRDGPFAVRRAVHVTAQICRALGAAHEVGIIHRDLKSDNVFLTTRGKDPDFVKVLDFGICKQADGDTSQTTPGAVLGSPDYMAPEQAAGADATVAADVYAVGCMLFEMLTGKLPYGGRNAIEVLMKKNTVDAPRVTELRPEVPSGLAEVIARCLSRRPEDRPPSMRVLEYELTRAVDGRATAVAAVLGISMPPEARADDDFSAASSASLRRSAVAESPPPARTPRPVAGRAPAARHHHPAGRPAASAVAKPPSGAVSSLLAGSKALFFVLLGGLLAGGLVVALRPDMVAPLLADFGSASAVEHEPVQPTPRGQPEPPPAPPPVVPVPPSQQNAARDVDALVERAEAALAAERWREPAEESVALTLSRIQLEDPGHESIGRLRRKAAEQLLPAGMADLERKRWLEAANTFRDLVAVWPEHPEARINLAEALRNQGRVMLGLSDHEKALVTADELLNMVPEDFAAHTMRAQSLAGLKRWGEAAEAYAAALELNPRHKPTKKALRKTRLLAKKAASKVKRAEG